jgi:hypothetical protein
VGVEHGLRRRTAILAELREDGTDGEMSTTSVARLLAMVAVALLTVALTVLPSVTALGLAPDAVTSALTASASVAALVGGGKLAVTAWGLVSGARDRSEAQTVCPSFD